MLSRFNLKGRNALITGGLGMVGQICHDVVKKLGGHATTIDIASGANYDVSNRYIVKSMAEFTSSKIDILINCAIGNQKAHTDPLHHWESDIAIGLSGMAYMSYYFGERMAKEGGGVILNIGSDLSHIGPDNDLYPVGHVKPASYLAVKHGVIGLTRYFAVLWPSVRCNCICPGGIDVGQKVPRNPMNRLMQPDELVGPIALLISDASSYMTGSILTVDGGRTAI